MADAAAYARFSSDEQDKQSTTTQFSKIEEQAVKNGDRNIAPFSDEGKSGRTADREHFMEMFNAIKAGKLKVEKIYVYKFSRFMRNAEESIFFKMRLEALGVDVVSVMEPLPEASAVAEFMERIIELTDKFQSDTIGIHARSGMDQLVKTGYWTGGPAPFGYLLDEIDNREGYRDKDGDIIKRGTLRPDEKVVPLIKRMYDLSVSGLGGNRIYAQLCKEFGGPICGGKGKPLGGRGVNDILRKTIYKGLFIYGAHGCKNVYDEEHRNERRMRQKRVRKPEAEWVRKQNEDWRIISDDLWEAAQKNRLKNARADFGNGPKRAAFLLTGMMTCEICGGGVAGHWQENADGSNRYHYYRCRGAMHGSGVCANKSKIRGLALERAVVQAVEQNLVSKKFLDDLVAEIMQIRDEHLASISDRSAMQNRRDELTIEIARLVDLAAKLPNTQEIVNKIGILEHERGALEKTLAAAAPPAQVDPQWLRAEVEKRLSDTLALMKSEGDIAARRSELMKLVAAIRLSGSGEVSIKWRREELLACIDEDLRAVVKKNQISDGWNPLPLNNLAG